MTGIELKVTLASWARWRWMNFVPHCLYCFVSGDQFWLLSSPRWRWQWASGEGYKSNSVVYTDLRSFLDALDARCANVFLRPHLVYPTFPINSDLFKSFASQTLSFFGLTSSFPFPTLDFDHEAFNACYTPVDCRLRLRSWIRFSTQYRWHSVPGRQNRSTYRQQCHSRCIKPRSYQRRR